MGILLVQLLVRCGAFVVAAARGQRKVDAITRAGAQAAVDYNGPDWTEAALDAGGQPPAVVFDGVGGELGEAAFDLMANGGRFSAHGAASGGFTWIDPEKAHRMGVTVTTIADLQYAGQDRARLMNHVLAELDAGGVQPLLSRMFALADAKSAHASLEARTTVGKSLLLP
jgi:NADPH2:quinone reductase